MSDPMERLVDALAGIIVARAESRPKTVDDWIALQNPSGLDRIAYQAGVNSDIQCSLHRDSRDGVVVIVPSNPHHTGVYGLGIMAFDHDTAERTFAGFGIESAKQLVNRLGEAIAVAERLRDKR